MRATNTIYSDGDGVHESYELALAIDEAINEELTGHLDEQKRLVGWTVGLGALAIALGIVFMAAGTSPALGAVAIIGGIAVGAGGVAYAQRREPMIAVDSIEQGYWTGYAIPDGDEVVLYDATESVPESEFTLDLVEDRDALTRSAEQLAALQEFPVVMSSDDNVEAEFAETLDGVRSELDDAERKHLSAPMIDRTQSARDAVKGLIERASAPPVETSTAVDAATAREDVSILSDLEAMASEDTGEAELETLRETSQDLAGELNGLQETVVDLLNDHTASVADAFGLLSFHFYCPSCLTDDIESRLELRDIDDDVLRCDTCREEFGTDEVVPHLRIRDDVVDPTCEQLWAEKDDQRRNVYQDIEDQKSELEEREFEQRQEAIRTVTDRIQRLRTEIRDLRSDARAAEGSVEEVSEMLVEYDRLNEAKKRQFTTDVAEVFEEIDEETERLLEATRAEEQERIQDAQEEAAQKAELLQEEQRQWEAEKMSAQFQHQEQLGRQEMQQQQQLFAAEMQHDQWLTEKELEQEAKHQRENWMLKTRGKTGIWDRADKFRMRKDRIWRQSARGDE